MTREEAVNWLINIRADIGQARHSELWHYEKALAEIIDLLKTAPEVQVARDIATILENEQDMRVMLRPEIERKKGKWLHGKTEIGALDIQYEEKICSECGWSHSLVIPNNYCPNCGSYNGGTE